MVAPAGLTPHPDRPPSRSMKNMMKKLLQLWTVSVLMLVSSNLSAQWLQQSFELQPGWNAVYLHVDATHTVISDLAQGSPVEEVWMWRQRLSSAQYFANPEAPSAANSRWTSWKSSLGDSTSELKSMPANAAYLVKLGGTVNYTWDIVGRPMAPNAEWTSSGLNLLGVPSVETSPPNLEAYFGPARDFLNVAEIFAYQGGPLGPSNPARVFGLRSTPAKRGQAFWMRAEDRYVRYFSPFAVELQSPGGFDFGASRVAMRMRLKNQTSADLTVSLNSVSSAAAPAGEKTVSGEAPVIIRGALDSATLAFGVSDLTGGPVEWVLKPAGQPGSDVEVVIGVNRKLMTGAVGDLFASVLRFTDSLGHSQIDVPVSAEVGTLDGLWIGEVKLNEVQHSLDTDSTSYGSTASSYPVRVILHQESLQVNSTADVAEGVGVSVPVPPLSRIISAGETLNFPGGAQFALTANAALNDTSLTGDLTGAGIVSGATGKLVRTRLFQRIYLGVLNNTLPGVTNKESLLESTEISTAVRISSVHLPFSDVNSPWMCAGELMDGGALSTTVNIGYNQQASNPFVHTYHPDHDNLSADFSRLQPVGQESFTIQRSIGLNFQAATQDFNGLARTSQQLTGVYEESMTLFGPASDAAPNEKTYRFRGPFTLNRISTIDTLTLE